MTPHTNDVAGHDTGFPYVVSKPCATDHGTPYLTRCGVHLIARPSVDLATVSGFLDGFEPTLGFRDYLDDPVPLTDSARLCKFAGQLCYMSFGAKRTQNREAERYFTNIKSSGHGSVLEHATFSFILYGISRSLTHELIRHRAGFAYSQVSQRYVSGKVVRFVERPEFQRDPSLHARFMERIDRAAADYEEIAETLVIRQKAGDAIMSAEARTDLRKKVQQAARAVLPNETEAPIVASANVRAWRHFLEMRASEHAEIEIRALAMSVYDCLAVAEPILLEDYHVVALRDGTRALETEYPKV
jgi:thymidylate synthase (FAD)